MEKEQLTLGSLFDGSGGFMLAARNAGIKPLWASELAPFPTAVTRKNFPEVKHYGDIRKLKGDELEPVDIITFGSTCTSFSVAGKREGFEGSSGIYVEAIRVIGEMLEKTEGKFPRFCVFENVPGLLSSSGGDDFIRCLDMLQELGFLPDANILDAREMGVPQRRRRIYITWININHILQKRTSISGSITLQLCTEILLTGLAEMLKAYDIGLPKSVSGLKCRSEDGLKKRMRLFGLHKEENLKMLLKNLDEMCQTYGSTQIKSIPYSGENMMDDNTRIAEDILSRQHEINRNTICTEKSWKSILEEILHQKRECIISTQSKQIIRLKICSYLKVLQNMLTVTIHLMSHAEERKDVQFLNSCEWVSYTLTEAKEKLMYIKLGFYEFQTMPLLIIMIQ